jgi:hypothetical protein
MRVKKMPRGFPKLSAIKIFAPSLIQERNTSTKRLGHSKLQGNYKFVQVKSLCDFNPIHFLSFNFNLYALFYNSCDGLNLWGQKNYSHVKKLKKKKKKKKDKKIKT